LDLREQHVEKLRRLLGESRGLGHAHAAHPNRALVNQNFEIAPPEHHQGFRRFFWIVAGHPQCAEEKPSHQLNDRKE
jgi:hypothetical protein